MAFDPFKNAFYGPFRLGGKLSLPIDLKGTQAILRAKTPVITIYTVEFRWR